MAQIKPASHVLDSSDRGPALTASSIVFIAAATIAVALRLVARRLKKLSWAADDYLVVVALLLVYGMFIALLYCIQNGLGKKRLTSISALLQASKWLYVFEALFPVATAATKLSILYLYKRIFTTFNRPWAWALYTVTALQLGWAVSGFFTTVFQCWPVDLLWRIEGGVLSKHRAGHCIDIILSLTALASINTALNTAVLILPIPMVWKLHTSRKQKIALSAIFILGCADILISIVRTYITSQPFDDFSTFLWKQALTIILSFAEPCVAIVCACLPVMRPLSKVFSKLFASSWLPLSGRSSHDTDRSGTAPISSECSVLEPVRSGPSVTNMVQGGFSSRWPLRDEEQAQKGIKVTSELDQFATGR